MKKVITIFVVLTVFIISMSYMYFKITILEERIAKIEHRHDLGILPAK